MTPRWSCTRSTLRGSNAWRKASFDSESPACGLAPQGLPKDYRKLPPALDPVTLAFGKHIYDCFDSMLTTVDAGKAAEAVTHDEHRHFDAENARLISDSGKVAFVAYQMRYSLAQTSDATSR